MTDIDTTAGVEIEGHNAEITAAAATGEEIAIRTKNAVPDEAGKVALRVVDEAGEQLRCERCPLILPGIAEYWGVVNIDPSG